MPGVAGLEQPACLFGIKTTRLFRIMSNQVILYPWWTTFFRSNEKLWFGVYLSPMSVEDIDNPEIVLNVVISSASFD